MSDYNPAKYKTDIDRFKNEITSSGLDLNLEVIIPAFTKVSYDYDLPLDVRDSLSPHQFYSKAWMIYTMHLLKTWHGPNKTYPALSEETSYNLSVFGCWLGFGTALILENTELMKNEIDVVFLNDINDKALSYATKLVTNLGYDVDGTNDSMAELSDRYYGYRAGLIVNTSLEHMTVPVRDKWWTKVVQRGGERRIAILQATDMVAEDHGTPYKSVDDLLIPGFKEILYAGELNFGDCSRFMVIGEV